jgi:hypothetical protein
LDIWAVKVPCYYYVVIVVFCCDVLIQNNIIATEQPQYVTKRELDWVKIKLKKSKDLLIGAFYMPHRNKKDMEELEKSLKIITAENNNK